MAKQSNLSQLLSALPNLTQAQLAQVKLAVEHLLVPEPAPGTDPTVIVFDCLMKVLNLKMGYRDLQLSSVYKLWQRDAPGCLAFVEETFPLVTHSKVMQMAVLRFLLEALRDHLKAGRIPITVGTMIKSLNRIPQVFEAAFPNYRESGLTDLILKSMKAVKE